MADVRVGGAFVDFVTRNAQFIQGVRRVGGALRLQQRAVRRLQRTLRGFNRSVRNTVRRLLNWRTALFTLIGSGGLGLLIKQNVQSADAIIKNARAVGLSAEAFQELRFAAELGGISQEAFTSGLTAFAKRVGEARSETGTLVTLLRRLDETLLSNLQAAEDTDEAFNLIIDAAIKMENRLDRTALLAAAFGRTVGPQLTNFLLQGRQGIDALRERARELGIVLGTDALRGAESLNDRLTELGRTLQAGVTRAIVENAQAIENLVDIMLVNLPRAIELLSDFGNLLAQVFGHTEDDLLHDLENLQLRLREVRAEIARGTTGENALSRALGFENFEEEAASIERRIEIIQRRLGRIRAVQAPVTTPTISTNETEQSVRQLEGPFGRLFDVIVNGTNRVKDGIDQVNETSKRFGQGLGRVLEVAVLDTRSLGDAFRNLGREILRNVVRRTVIEPFSNAISGALNAVLGGGGQMKIVEGTTRSIGAVNEVLKGTEAASEQAEQGCRTFAKCTERVNGLCTQMNAVCGENISVLGRLGKAFGGLRDIALGAIGGILRAVVNLGKRLGGVVGLFGGGRAAGGQALGFLGGGFGGGGFRPLQAAGSALASGGGRGALSVVNNIRVDSSDPTVARQAAHDAINEALPALFQTLRSGLQEELPSMIRQNTRYA